MHPELLFQEELAIKYNYKKLDKELSAEVRKRYRNNLPKELNENGDFIEVYTLDGTHIAKGYSRIVIGDYGAFIEIKLSSAISSNMKVKPGQEFRATERFKTCKYHWLTAKDNTDIKIYLQKNRVSYADYEPGFIYVSPYEIKVKEHEA